MKYWSAFIPINSSHRLQRCHFSLQDTENITWEYESESYRGGKRNIYVRISWLPCWSGWLSVSVSIQGHELKRCWRSYYALPTHRTRLPLCLHLQQWTNCVLTFTLRPFAGCAAAARAHYRRVHEWKDDYCPPGPRTDLLPPRQSGN